MSKDYIKDCVLCGKEYETDHPFSKICFDCNEKKKIKRHQKCSLCGWDYVAFKKSDGYGVRYYCPNHHWQITHGKIDMNGNEIIKKT